MPFKACEKHGGQLYPDNEDQCPLCKAGVVTPTKEAQPATKQPATGTKEQHF
jgi:hypothetical protein